MGQDDGRATGNIQQPARASLESLNIADFVRGLVGDLEDLRARKITVVEARARAQLAHEILRGIGQIVHAQKFIDGALRLIPPPTPEKKKRVKTINAKA